MNPLLAVIRGTTATMDNAAQSLGDAAQRAMMPTNAMYSLGMGIGPWLRNITAEAKRGNDERSKASNDHKKDVASAKKQSTMLSGQLNSMIVLLRDLRNIGMIQLRADQARLVAARRKEYMSRNGSKGSALGGSLTATGDKPQELFSELLGPGMKLALAAILGYQIWDKLIDDDVKNQFKEWLFGSTQSLFGSIADMWAKASVSDKVMTGVAALILAKVSGALGLVTGAGQVAWWLGKNAAKPLAGDTQPGSTTNKTVSPGIGGAGVAVTAELAEMIAAQALARKAQQGGGPSPTATTRPDYSGMTGAEKLKAKRLYREEMAANNKAAAAAEQAAKAAETSKLAQEATIASKMIGVLDKAGAWATKGLIGVGALGSGYAAYSANQEGKNYAATLHAIAAALGTGALFMPAAAPALLTTSLLTGLMGSAIAAFEEGKPAPTPPTPANVPASQPNIAATRPQRITNDPSAPQDWTDDDWEKLANMIGARESGAAGYSAIEQKNGNYIGRYQMGTQALESVGLLKAGTYAREGTRGLRNRENWVNGLSMESFLSSPEMQDKAWRRFHLMNIEAMRKAGVVTPQTTKSELAGLLMGSQFGASNMINYAKNGVDFADANGTRISSYYNAGVSGFNGAPIQNQSMLANAGNPSAFNVTSADTQQGQIIGVLSEVFKMMSGNLGMDVSRMAGGANGPAINNTTYNTVQGGGGMPATTINSDYIERSVRHVQ